MKNSLFSAEELPRRKHRVLMNLTDFGYSQYQLICPKCNYHGTFNWIGVNPTKAQVERNRLCPECNEESQ